MSYSLRRWQNKVAVVTGASAGIGAAIAQKLVEEGLQVVGLARKSDKVEDLAKKLLRETGKLYAYKANITSEEEVLKAFDWIFKNVGPVSILVNNAGIGFAGTLLDGETQFWKQTLDTNVLALSVCTREAIKQMRSNGIDGQIIHIGSVPIYINSIFPSFNMWTPSKTAVASLTEMLRQELNQIGSKIKVSIIKPGAVTTEGLSETGIDVDSFPTLQSIDVADAVKYILSTPPHVQIHEIIIKSVGEMF